MSRTARIALNTELKLENGQAPEWVEVIPAPDAHGFVTGRDGRVQRARHRAGHGLGARDPAPRRQWR